MAESERERVESSRPSSSSGAAAPSPFEQAKRHLLLACGAIGGGLAIAGTLDRTTGGVLVLVGWLASIVSLHRLGRTGSDRGGAGAAPSPSSKAPKAS